MKVPDVEYACEVVDPRPVLLSPKFHDQTDTVPSGSMLAVPSRLSEDPVGIVVDDGVKLATGGRSVIVT